VLDLRWLDKRKNLRSAEGGREGERASSIRRKKRAEAIPVGKKGIVPDMTFHPESARPSRGGRKEPSRGERKKREASVYLPCEREGKTGCLLCGLKRKKKTPPGLCLYGRGKGGIKGVVLSASTGEKGNPLRFAKTKKDQPTYRPTTQRAKEKKGKDGSGTCL